MLHQVDDRGPAGGIELVLQRIARGMTAGAVVVHEVLEPRILGRGVRQRSEHQVARQLPLEIGKRIELEVLLLRAGQVDLALGGREGESLRPDPILAGGERREIVIARIVGEDRGGDGRAFGLGRHRHAVELLARCRGDGSRKQRISGLRRDRHQRACSQSGRRDRGEPHGSLSETLGHGFSPWDAVLLSARSARLEQARAVFSDTRRLH